LTTPAPARRALLERRIRFLVTATIGYNLVEAAIALTEGVRASSAALLGFGLDSLVEVSSAAAVAWQFSAADPRRRERAALRFVAIAFFALAAYIAVESALALAGVREARPSPIGIALSAAGPGHHHDQIDPRWAKLAGLVLTDRDESDGQPA